MSARKRLGVFALVVLGALLVGWSVVGRPFTVSRSSGESGASVECKAAGLPIFWVDSMTTNGAEVHRNDGPRQTKSFDELAFEARQACLTRAHAFSTGADVVLLAGIVLAFVVRSVDRRTPITREREIIPPGPLA